MMKRSRKPVLISLALSLAATHNAFAYTGEKLATGAKITLDEARAIALNAYPGKIIDEALEKEKGGSGLRYSFDIQRDKITQEVGIDAQSGTVLENRQEASNANDGGNIFMDTP